MFQTKVTDKVNRDILYSINFFKVGTVYVIMWKNIVEPDRPQVSVVWCMCFACWIPKVTDTHSEYVIFIAFPPQQWLEECTSMLRCMNIAILL